MDIDYKAAGFWLDFAQWLFIGLLAIWGYLRTKDKDNAQAVREVRRQLQDHITAAGLVNIAQDTRLTTLEEKVKHMPTDEEIAHLTSDISSLKAQVNGVASLLSRVEHQTQLIHEHLLRQK